MTIRLHVEWLHAIDAPHFFAGLIVCDGVVIHAAPILRWTTGKDWRGLKEYFESKEWKVSRCP